MAYAHTYVGSRVVGGLIEGIMYSWLPYLQRHLVEEVLQCDRNPYNAAD